MCESDIFHKYHIKQENIIVEIIFVTNNGFLIKPELYLA